MRFATGIPEIDGIDRFIQTCAWQAAKYAFNLGCRIDQEDLYQVGLLDAWKSYQEWDRSRGTSFLSFCGNQLRWRIFREVQNNCATVRIPVHAWAEGIRPIPCEEIEEASSIAEDAEMTSTLAKMDLNAVARKLPRKHRIVLLLRAEGYTLESIGKGFGYTRERIRQIEVIARGQLQSLAQGKLARVSRDYKQFERSR